MVPNRYHAILEWVFTKGYKRGTESIVFSRDALVEAAEALKLKVPKNLGDIVYSRRYRDKTPEQIASKTPKGKEWLIVPRGRGRYAFQLLDKIVIAPSPGLLQIKVPDSTPGLVARYSFNDEQALLSKIRYNRLIDTFLGVTCYSLQNHLRTTVADMGQVETDELYVGIDRWGVQYIMPVQAKGGRDRIGLVQIMQDLAMTSEKFPHLLCRPVAASFADSNVIALFEFAQQDGIPVIAREKQYRLVAPEALSDDELAEYLKSAAEG